MHRRSQAGGRGRGRGRGREGKERGRGRGRGGEEKVGGGRKRAGVTRATLN